MEKARRIALVIGWIGVAIVIMFYIFFVIAYTMEDDGSTIEITEELYESLENLANVLAIVLIVSLLLACVPGWVHCFTSTFSAAAWMIFVFPFWLGLMLLAGALTSWFFIIRDTYRVIRKKPLA